MEHGWGLPRRALWLIAGGSLPLMVFGQNAPRMAPVPADPLELVTGPVQRSATSEERGTALQLLTHARDNFALRSAGTAYDLKLAFTVDSRGQTNYDGAWEMEIQYVPGKGTRWTAKAAAGYVTTMVSSHGKTYAEGGASVIPLRLHEARALLMDPLPSSEYADRGSIRTSAATFDGAPVTCILLARSRNPANPATGRGWEESEDCIDPRSGLLQTHSEAPGRYVIYDYANTVPLGGRVLPQTVSIAEAGQVVSRISVESLREIADPDPSLFAATGPNGTAGTGVAIAAMTKMSRTHGQGPFTSVMTVRPVCVFGVVTSTGQLVEAHSLQPSDPNSEAAIADARSIDFSPAIAAGTPPQQHFVFVIERFVSSQ